MRGEFAVKGGDEGGVSPVWQGAQRMKMGEALGAAARETLDGEGATAPSRNLFSRSGATLPRPF